MAALPRVGAGRGAGSGAGAARGGGSRTSDAIRDNIKAVFEAGFDNGTLPLRTHIEKCPSCGVWNTERSCVFSGISAMICDARKKWVKRKPHEHKTKLGLRVFPLKPLGMVPPTTTLAFARECGMGAWWPTQDMQFRKETTAIYMSYMDTEGKATTSAWVDVHLATHLFMTVIDADMLLEKPLFQQCVKEDHLALSEAATWEDDVFPVLQTALESLPSGVPTQALPPLTDPRVAALVNMGDGVIPLTLRKAEQAVWWAEHPPALEPMTAFITAITPAALLGRLATLATMNKIPPAVVKAAQEAAEGEKTMRSKMREAMAKAMNDARPLKRARTGEADEEDDAGVSWC